MSSSRLAWIACLNLAAVIAVFAAFDAVSGLFETLVLSGLVVIYVSVTARLVAIGHGVDELATRISEQHASAMTHLDAGQASQLYAALKLAREKSVTTSWAILLKSGFNVVLLAIALVYAALAWLGL